MIETCGEEGVNSWTGCPPAPGRLPRSYGQGGPTGRPARGLTGFLESCPTCYDINVSHIGQHDTSA